MKNNRFILINIAYLGALIALQVVLGNLVQIAMLTKQMNFGFLPIAVAGYLFGPLGGLLVAALGDVIGTILFGTGAYFPGFTVTAALSGAVYGLVLFSQISPLDQRMLQEQNRRLADPRDHRLYSRRCHQRVPEFVLADFLYHQQRILGDFPRTYPVPPD